MTPRKISCFALALACSSLTLPAWAMSDNCIRQISMHFTAEHWVNSETSLVSVGLSASVPAKDVDKLTDAIKTKLASISKNENWRLVNLVRRENDSGLITVTGQAVARLNHQALNTLQTELKSLNKPGEKYQIDNIDYQADLTTINTAKSELRKNLYQQALSGEKELNDALPNAKPAYQIYKINFNDGATTKPVTYMAASMHAKQRNNASQDTSLSEKMTMNAHVTYGAPIENCGSESD